MQHGSILRASIGISISLITHSSSGGVTQAIRVRKVKDTEQSPLLSGDILLEINGRRLARRIDVIRALNRDSVDQRLEVLIERDGASKTVEVLAKARTSNKL